MRSSHFQLRFLAKPRLPYLQNAPTTRSFSISQCRAILTTEMSEKQLGAIQVNRARLWRDLHVTCEWGKGERWGDGPTDIGMSRLALSDSDKQARDWFVETTKDLGCEVKIDEMGNIFAIRPGRDNSRPPTYAGSHLDTQPTGGRYDGILGVHAGIEALRTMRENDIETEYPTGVINWTNEEGARFPISMVASGVWASAISLQKAYSVPSVSDSETQKSALEKINYLGSIPASHEVNPIGAHFELHIEQGPILESSGGKIGAVEGVQAYKWFTITVKGRDCHTGTTDFANRSDALLCAAKLILHSHNRAAEKGCLASTGILGLKPGSTNTVPGFVTFSLDIRSRDDGQLRELENALKEGFERIARGEDVGGVNERGVKGRGCSVEWRLDTDSPATKFHEDCVRCVEESAKSLVGVEDGIQVQRMTSGAGHDSVYTARHAPTSMIFVPCRDGVSHNPAEYCSPEDCGNGAQVLLGAMLRYDRLLAQRKNRTAA